MTEWVTYGSVGGAAGNSRSYPEVDSCSSNATMSTSERAQAETTTHARCYPSTELIP